MFKQFDSSQDNDTQNDTNTEMFDGISNDPLDLMIALEEEMGMSIVEAVRLARGVCRSRRADAELEFNRVRKMR